MSEYSLTLGVKSLAIKSLNDMAKLSKRIELSKNQNQIKSDVLPSFWFLAVHTASFLGRWDGTAADLSLYVSVL